MCWSGSHMAILGWCVALRNYQNPHGKSASVFLRWHWQFSDFVSTARWDVSSHDKRKSNDTNIKGLTINTVVLSCQQYNAGRNFFKGETDRISHAPEMVVYWFSVLSSAIYPHPMLPTQPMKMKQFNLKTPPKVSSHCWPWFSPLINLKKYIQTFEHLQWIYHFSAFST